MTPLRTALVGYGSAGSTIHGPLLAAARADFQVSDVVTSNPDRAAAARTAHPGVTVHPSYDALWESGAQPEVVVVATPNTEHVPQAVAAMQRGCHVVVDKPLAVRHEDALAASDVSSSCGGRLTVFHNRRWDSAHLTARRVLADGLVGQVLRHEACFERWRPEPKDRWRERLPSEEGGGLLMDLQSHLVDGAVQLLGPVVAVYAELRSVTTIADDMAFLAVEHESGVTSHLSATSLGGAPGPRMRLLATEGSYVVGSVDMDEERPEWRDEEGHRGWLVRGGWREPVRREPGSWEDFYPLVARWVRGEGPAPVEPAEAVHVLAVLEAARRSAATGERVRVGVGVTT